jgi:hypothetical protein
LNPCEFNGIVQASGESISRRLLHIKSEKQTVHRRQTMYLATRIRNLAGRRKIAWVPKPHNHFEQGEEKTVDIPLPNPALSHQEMKQLEREITSNAVEIQLITDLPVLQLDRAPAVEVKDPLQDERAVFRNQEEKARQREETHRKRFAGGMFNTFSRGTEDSGEQKAASRVVGSDPKRPQDVEQMHMFDGLRQNARKDAVLPERNPEQDFLHREDISIRNIGLFDGEELGMDVSEAEGPDLAEAMQRQEKVAEEREAERHFQSQIDKLQERKERILRKTAQAGTEDEQKELRKGILGVAQQYAKLIVRKYPDEKEREEFLATVREACETDEEKTFYQDLRRYVRLELTKSA